MGTVIIQDKTSKRYLRFRISRTKHSITSLAFPGFQKKWQPWKRERLQRGKVVAGD